MHSKWKNDERKQEHAKQLQSVGLDGEYVDIDDDDDDPINDECRGPEADLNELANRGVLDFLCVFH